MDEVLRVGGWLPGYLDVASTAAELALLGVELVDPRDGESLLPNEIVFANRRLAELTDIVQELLVPLAQRDEDKINEYLERYSSSL